MKIQRLMLLAACFYYVSVAAQSKQTDKKGQIWAAYLNQTRFSNRWGLWLDAHLRTKEEVFSGLSQTIFRPGITYHISNATKITAGYAFVNHFPEYDRQISQPEHRPWQQVQWHSTYGRVKTMQWFRLEQRFRRKILNDSTLGEGYRFNYRMRYNFLLQVPLTKAPARPGALSFIANDEVHVNFGREIVYNYFDQNRFFLGFALNTGGSNNLQFGYMNFFQQLPAGNRYRMAHTARIFYFHNLDLRKKL